MDILKYTFDEYDLIKQVCKLEKTLVNFEQRCCSDIQQMVLQRIGDKSSYKKRHHIMEKTITLMFSNS